MHSQSVIYTSDAPGLSMQEMYNIQHKLDAPFGIPGYKLPVKYHDAQKIVQEREWAEMHKKPYNQRPQPPRATKKLGYLDIAIKENQGVPGPQKYNVTKEWAKKEQTIKGKGQDRITFIDSIFKEQKIRHVPGVGKYNVVKTLEDMKKEQEEQSKRRIKQGEKILFYDDQRYLANQQPGPGQYNPHDVSKNEIVKLKINTTKPDDWIKKHKSQSAHKKSDMPAVGSYKNNFPADYDTFGKSLVDLKDKSAQKSTVNYMGKEKRFFNVNQKQQALVPGSGQYQMIAKWPGKLDKNSPSGDKKDKNWMNNVSRGISKSIYY